MFCTHLNYKLNWSIFFRFNCACAVKPLAGQTEQTWHSLACAVKTEGKTVHVWGPLERAGLNPRSIWLLSQAEIPTWTRKHTTSVLSHAAWSINSSRWTVRHTSATLAWFQASAAKQLRTALFWSVRQRSVLVTCRRFGGATYWSHLQRSILTWNMARTDCPETTVTSDPQRWDQLAVPKRR
jgi:hypothetical protein